MLDSELLAAEVDSDPVGQHIRLAGQFDRHEADKRARQLPGIAGEERTGRTLECKLVHERFARKRKLGTHDRAILAAFNRLDSTHLDALDRRPEHPIVQQHTLGVFEALARVRLEFEHSVRGGRVAGCDRVKVFAHHGRGITRVFDELPGESGDAHEHRASESTRHELVWA